MYHVFVVCVRSPKCTLCLSVCRKTWTDEKWWDVVSKSFGRWVKAHSRQAAKLGNQVPRHRSKKGGVKKRLYVWAAISMYGKSKLIAWLAQKKSDVIFRHTKNLRKGTLFEDDDVVWRVVQGRTKLGGDDVVYYVQHGEYPDKDPPLSECERSSFAEVKEWHLESRDRLVGMCSYVHHTCMHTNTNVPNMHARTLSHIYSVRVSYGVVNPDFQIPTGMQDKSKTIGIYRSVSKHTAKEYIPYMHERPPYVLLFTSLIRLVDACVTGRRSIHTCRIILSTRLWKTTPLVIIMNAFDNYIRVRVSNWWVTRPPTKRRSKSKSSSVSRSMCTSGHTHVSLCVCYACTNRVCYACTNRVCYVCTNRLCITSVSKTEKPN